MLIVVLTYLNEVPLGIPAVQWHEHSFWFATAMQVTCLLHAEPLFQESKLKRSNGKFFEAEPRCKKRFPYSGFWLVEVLTSFLKRMLNFIIIIIINYVALLIRFKLWCFIKEILKLCKFPLVKLCIHIK